MCVCENISIGVTMRIQTPSFFVHWQNIQKCQIKCRVDLKMYIFQESLLDRYILMTHVLLLPCQQYYQLWLRQPSQEMENKIKVRDSDSLNMDKLFKRVSVTQLKCSGSTFLFPELLNKCLHAFNTDGLRQFLNCSNCIMQTVWGYLKFKIKNK